MCTFRPTQVAMWYDAYIAMDTNVDVVCNMYILAKTSVDVV